MWGENVKIGNVKELRCADLKWRIKHNSPDLSSGEFARYLDPV